MDYNYSKKAFVKGTREDYNWLVEQGFNSSEIAQISGAILNYFYGQTETTFEDAKMQEAYERLLDNAKSDAEAFFVNAKNPGAFELKAPVDMKQVKLNGNEYSVIDWSKPKITCNTEELMEMPVVENINPDDAYLTTCVKRRYHKYVTDEDTGETIQIEDGAEYVGNVLRDIFEETLNRYSSMEDATKDETVNNWISNSADSGISPIHVLRYFKHINGGYNKQEPEEALSFMTFEAQEPEKDAYEKSIGNFNGVETVGNFTREAFEGVMERYNSKEEAMEDENVIEWLRTATESGITETNVVQYFEHKALEEMREIERQQMELTAEIARKQREEAFIAHTDTQVLDMSGTEVKDDDLLTA